MTLIEALAIVHPWLGTWMPGEVCEQDSDIPISFPCHRNDPQGKAHWERPAWHHIPMPPATDELAMKVLRKLQEGTEVPMFNEESRTQVMVPDPHEPELWHDGGRWNCRTDSWAETYQARDPRDAIIIAAATWLQSQEKQKE